MKASAQAHPIQGLIKYHGLRDEVLRLPFHDSISVCTAPLITRTTVEFGHESDTATIDGRPANAMELGRIQSVIHPIRKAAGEGSGARVVSENNFRSNIGLGASSSGFAALALASCLALGLDLSLEEISRFARRGAGSASRAVTGGFSRWFAGTGDQDSLSRRIDAPEMDMAILVAIVPALKHTEMAHREVLTSPFFRARLEYIGPALDEMERAIRKGDLRRVGELAEKDTLLLHGVTMTGVDSFLLWRPETLRVILEVRRMREEGIPCYFSIDTGATVYVNMPRPSLGEVRSRIASLGVETIVCEVGGEAREIEDHLF